MKGWKKSTITVATTQGPDEIDCYVKAGLAVHRRVNDVPPDEKWCITHIASGQSIASRAGWFASEADAIAAADAVLPLTDWSADRHAIKALGIGGRVEKAVAAFPSRTCTHEARP